MNRSLTEWLAAYHEDRTACMEAVFQQENRYELCLELFTALFDELKERYQKLGISEQIYRDTRSDLEIWRGNCRRMYGVDGLANYRWLQNHLDLKLFRLGRLQFEPVVNEGRIALNVHIPQGEPLVYEACRESYRQAYAFYHGMTDRFVCHSWLLSPVLQELLPESSNIVRFQKDFEITHYDPNDRQCEERVFGEISDDYGSYPQKTSLQRAVREKLLRGEPIGAAQGEFRYRMESN
ncbi:MAG: acyltransferase domain-containing protein [Candidatus Merdivicinus sp.]|jgi:hypothetical protein